MVPICQHKGVFDWFYVNLFIIPDKSFIGGRYSTVRLHLQQVIQWWHLGCKERWTPPSTIKFGWSVKIRSIQDDEFGRRCVESDINCCNPYGIASDSVWGPLRDVISSHHHDLDLALKSPSIKHKITKHKTTKHKITKHFYDDFSCVRFFDSLNQTGCSGGIYL